MQDAVKIEGCNKPFIDAMREYDDGLDLTDYDFANDAFVGAAFNDDSNKKKLAYRHRIIVQKYKKKMDRLPTRAALIKRHIQVPSSLCPLCSQYDETIEHLLINCEYANMLWGFISTWCKIVPIFAFSVREIICYAEKVPGNYSKVIHAIILIACWCIWKSRNDVCFNGTTPSWHRLKEDTQSLSFLWIKSRARWHHVTWENWIEFRIEHQNVCRVDPG